MFFYNHSLVQIVKADANYSIIHSITYQDDNGEIFTESMEVSTKILQPVISPSPTPDPALQQAQSQWWITALIGFAIIAIIVSGVVVSRFAREMRMR